MTAYALQDLLRVRKFREDRAASEVGAAKRAQEECAAVEERKRKESAEYKTWREKRENVLYDGVLGREVRVGELENLKTDVLALREKELLMEQAVLEAQAAERKASETLKQARREHSIKVKDRRKIEEHRKAWIAAEHLVEERAADAEMEEVPFNPPSADEEDESSMMEWLDE